MNLLVWLWRRARPLQWRLSWLTHATFVCGVVGVVRSEDGRVLLLRHRMWSESKQWGCPGGFAARGERHEDTIVREVREETGLTVTVGPLLRIRTGYRYRIEVYYEAVLVGGLDGMVLDQREILDARLFSLDELPANMPPEHRDLVTATLAATA